MNRDYFYQAEQWEQLVAERNHLQAEVDQLRHLWKLHCEDLMQGMECLPKCDSYGHEDGCPVNNPKEAFRKLRQQLADQRAEIADLRTTRDHIEKQLNKDLSNQRAEIEHLDGLADRLKADVVRLGGEGVELRHQLKTQRTVLLRVAWKQKCLIADQKDVIDGLVEALRVIREELIREAKLKPGHGWEPFVEQANAAIAAAKRGDVK